MARLQGRVAIISGSGRGIGRATALKLASEGAAVVVNDLDAAPADETVELITSAGGMATTCIGSVTDQDFGNRFVATAIDRFGGLDIIVNNAGYTHDGVIQRQSDAQFQAMLDVHTVAPFRILRSGIEAIRELRAREVRDGTTHMRKVVNISSISGLNGIVGQVNYSSAKSALVGMTKTLSKEWGRYGVCVNCVAFGLIATRLTVASDDPAARVEVEGKTIRTGIPAAGLEAMEAMIPLGRAGSVEEAAGSIYLMCAPESDYISGQVLLVAGGMSL